MLGVTVVTNDLEKEEIDPVSYIETDEDKVVVGGGIGVFGPHRYDFNYEDIKCISFYKMEIADE